MESRDAFGKPTGPTHTIHLRFVRIRPQVANYFNQYSEIANDLPRENLYFIQFYEVGNIRGRYKSCQLFGISAVLRPILMISTNVMQHA